MGRGGGVVGITPTMCSLLDQGFFAEHGSTSKPDLPKQSCLLRRSVIKKTQPYTIQYTVQFEEEKEDTDKEQH